MKLWLVVSVLLTLNTWAWMFVSHAFKPKDREITGNTVCAMLSFLLSLCSLYFCLAVWAIRWALA